MTKSKWTDEHTKHYGDFLRVARHASQKLEVTLDQALQLVQIMMINLMIDSMRNGPPPDAMKRWATLVLDEVERRDKEPWEEDE